VTPNRYTDADDTLRMLVDGKRLRDIADLPLDMCIGDLKHTADFAHSPCLT
jgi:hypothetical protein